MILIKDGEWCETADNWGYCGEGCPLTKSTWASDETLRVTTEMFKKPFVLDPEISLAIIGLGIMTICLLIIAAVAKYFGIFKI